MPVFPSGNKIIRKLESALISPDKSGVSIQASNATPSGWSSANGWRDLETRAATVELRFPKLRKGAAEKALTAMIQEPYIRGVSKC